MVRDHPGAQIFYFFIIPILKHFNTTSSKPGANFRIKGMSSFSNKLDTAINSNLHNLGSLKTKIHAVDTIKNELYKKQSQIRQGGLTTNQANNVLFKIQHEAQQKGEHLDFNQKNAIKKIIQHITKSEHPPSTPLNPLAVNAVSSLYSNQKTTSIKTIGDQTKIIKSGQKVTYANSGNKLLNKKMTGTADNTNITKPPIKPHLLDLSI